MDTKNQIIQTALKCFLTKGFHETSMREIAKEIGISKPAIYHHFENKDALVQEIFDYFTKRMQEWNKNYLADCKNEKDKLHKMFSAIPLFMNVEKILLQEHDNELYCNYNTFLLLLCRSNNTYKTRISQDYERTLLKMAQLFQKLKNKGEMKSDIDVNTTALMMVTIIEGLSFIGEICNNLNVKQESERLFQSFWKLIKNSV